MGWDGLIETGKNSFVCDQGLLVPLLHNKSRQSSASKERKAVRVRVRVKPQFNQVLKRIRKIKNDEPVKLLAEEKQLFAPLVSSFRFVSSTASLYFTEIAFFIFSFSSRTTNNNIN